MTLAVGILERAGQSLGESLPRIAGAFVLLVVGLLVAWIVGRVARRVLDKVGLDDLAARFGINRALTRLGLTAPASRLIASTLRIVLSVVVVVAALSLLGLGALDTALNEIVLFLPRLIVAVLLVLGGVVVAEFLGKRAERLGDQMALGGPLRQLIELIVLALFVLVALQELLIPTTIVLALVVILLGTLTLTVGLAFGLGGREVARELSAGRYLGGVFELGQTISVGTLRGEIVALERAATVLRNETGETVRVPNHLLVDSIVKIH